MGRHNVFATSKATNRANARYAALCVLAASLFLATPTSAGNDAVATPGWQSILVLQLKSDYNCDFEKLLFDRDVEAGGRKSKEGRIRCIDGREFDFSRETSHEKFTIRLCAPTVC